MPDAQLSEGLDGLEGLSDLGLLGLAHAVDEKLGLPDGDHAVDLSDDDVQAPVPRVGLNPAHGAVAQADKLRDQPLERLSSALLPARTDELMEADHLASLPDGPAIAKESAWGGR